MFVTPVDIIVIIVIMVSAFLAMVRGFSREILSVISWLLAAGAAYFGYGYVKPLIVSHLSSDTVATVVAIVVVFLISLLVISVVAMKIADIIVDSRVGPLDRTLGLLFGLGRGVIIMALAALLINNISKPENLSEWVVNAKTRPILTTIANTIWDAIPKNLLQFDASKVSFNGDNPSLFNYNRQLLARRAID